LTLKKHSVLVLCPSPRGTAATQRLKYEQYLDQLEKEGYQFTISPFQTKRFWKIIYKPGRIVEKIFWTLIGYLRRMGDLLRAPFYDAVFVNLWVTPLGFPFFERLLFLFNKRVIYDIDDMLFMNGKQIPKLSVQRLKGKAKSRVLMQKSQFVIVCTPRLEEIALELNENKNVVDISSTFNTDRFVPVRHYEQKETRIIGWTGTHSTLPYLDSLQPVLANVAGKRKIRLLVIANKPYQMRGVDTEFIYWNENTEVEDLQRMEIGLYPIPANEWSLGKSSLKALTYMAIAIPVIATAYGTNFRIMQDGEQGFLAKNEEEWVNRLIQLIDDAELRRRMGEAGRKTVEEHFSVTANIPKYRKAFNSVVKSIYS